MKKFLSFPSFRFQCQNWKLRKLGNFQLPSIKQILWKLQALKKFILKSKNRKTWNLVWRLVKLSEFVLFKKVRKLGDWNRHCSCALKVGCTAFFPISRHFKRQTPLISGQFFFHRQNSGQSLIKNFLKDGQVISGNSN